MRYSVILFAFAVAATISSAREDGVAATFADSFSETPYISTYYIKPAVTPTDDLSFDFFVTDARNSKIRDNDDSHIFDVEIELLRESSPWLRRTLKALRSGDHTVNLGKMPAGNYTLGIRCANARGIPSHTVWHEFVSAQQQPPQRELRVTRGICEQYGLIPETGRYDVIEVDLGDITGLEESALMELISKKLDETAAQTAVPATQYRIFTPCANGKRIPWGWRRSRVIYGAKYDKSAVESEARDNSRALQALLDDAAQNGYNRVRFLPETYRVSAHQTISLPGRMTVDLNGAKIKMNEFAGCRAQIVEIRHKHYTHLINGTIEGDYYEHDYANSENNSEWVCGVVMLGDCRNSSFENLTIQNITGYGVSNGTAPHDHTFSRTVSFYGTGLYTNGAINLSDGRVLPSEKLFTSPFRDISSFTNKYISVSKYLGYQGRRTLSWNYIAAFYDSEKNFISAELAFQYRIVLIPENAKYMRISVEAENIEKANECELSAQLFKTPWNCVFRDLQIIRARAVGMAPAAMRNMLIESNSFTESGENLARCAFDAEDGWDMMQDVFIRDNIFFYNPNNELLTCAGHNFVMERNKGSIHLWERTLSPCVRSNRLTTANFRCGDRLRTMHGRYTDNEYRDRLVVGGAKEKADWDAVITGEICSYTNKTLQIEASNNGRIRDAHMKNISSRSANFQNCEIENSEFIMTFSSFNWLGNSFKNCNIQHLNKTGVVSRCTFQNTSFSPFSGGNLAFYDSSFSNSTLNCSYWAKPNSVRFENCEIFCREATFFKTPVYSISEYIFDGCKISSGENAVIDIYDLRAQETDHLDASIFVQSSLLDATNTPFVTVSSRGASSTKKLSIIHSGYPLGALLAEKDLREKWRMIEYADDASLPQRHYRINDATSASPKR